MKNWLDDITRAKTNLIQVIEWKHSDCHLFVRTIYHFHISFHSLLLPFRFVSFHSICCSLCLSHPLSVPSTISSRLVVSVANTLKVSNHHDLVFDSMWCRNSPDNILDGSIATVCIIDGYQHSVWVCNGTLQPCSTVQWVHTTVHGTSWSWLNYHIRSTLCWHNTLIASTGKCL